MPLLGLLRSSKPRRQAEVRQGLAGVRRMCGAASPLPHLVLQSPLPLPHLPGVTKFNVSSPPPPPPTYHPPPPPPPQHDGKDPLAELIAATASRRRKGHSALAEKLLKECRIDQADIMFCRGSDGNLVQLGAGAYGQVGGWVVGGGQARRGGWVGGWADKEGGLSAGPWSVTPASSQPGCTRGSTCAAPILPPGILPTGGSP